MILFNCEESKKMIKKNLTLHLPYWWRDLPENPQDYYLIMTDDMDSFFSCRFLNRRFSVEIGGFYKFNNGIYLTDKAAKSDKQPIYVDCSIVRDGIMAFDNHRCLMSNHMIVNPNLVMDRMDNKTYFNKYCGGTLLFLCALYGGEFSELEKDFMIAIDSFSIGWYKDNGSFRKINEYWLDMLGMTETLTPTLNRHDMQYYTDLLVKYQLKEKIYIEENKLKTYSDILPHDDFILYKKTKGIKLSKEEIENTSIKNKIFVAAEIYKGSYICDMEVG